MLISKIWSLLSAPIVFQTNNVIFDTKSELGFDNDQIICAIIFDAVNIAQCNEKRVALLDFTGRFVQRKLSFALNNCPMFGTVLVFLQGQAFARMYDNTFHPITRLI